MIVFICSTRYLPDETAGFQHKTASKSSWIMKDAVTCCYERQSSKVSTHGTHLFCITDANHKYNCAKEHNITAFTNKAYPTQSISWNSGDTIKYIRLHSKRSYRALHPLTFPDMPFNFTMDWWKIPPTHNHKTYNVVLPLPRQTTTPTLVPWKAPSCTDDECVGRLR